MRVSRELTKMVIAGGLLIASTVLFANGTRFSDFTPLSSSAGPITPIGDPAEAAPITFGNPVFQQQSIADRGTQLLANMPNTGSWDMNTVNETGPHKGRYLFTVFETGQPGVQRHDLLSGVTDTIWHSLAAGTHASFDPSYWTPWGTFIVAEESWCTAAAGCTTSRNGRLFELKNPIDAPADLQPADGGEQYQRGLRAPERDSTLVSRRHTVRSSWQHVLHR